MKKLCFLISIVVLSFSAFAQTITIPNNSFETWTNNKTPDSWKNEYAQPDSTIKKVMPGYTGSYAMQVKVYHDPSLNTDEFGYVTSRFPISTATAPVKLTFYSKTKVVTGDSVRVSLSLFNNGSLIGTAVGRYGVQTNITSFSFRELTINYTSALVPDSAEIIIIAGDADNGAQKNGTYIIIDKVEFDGVNVGIYNAARAELLKAAYPNPAIQHINIPLPGNETVTVRITDLLGHEVMNIASEGSESLQLPVSSMSHGVYFYQVISKDQSIFNDKFVVGN